jgi:hypothetical protein
METKVLELQVRHTYGLERIYPINPPAVLLAKLLKKKTFDREDLKLLAELGYTFSWVAASI